MKITLLLEEAAMTVLGIYGLIYYNLGLSFWIWLLLFFSPDIGMLGYLLNTSVGAFTYNLFHHKGLALLIAATGFFAENHILTAIGILLFAHSAFDRMMGYGLKYADHFKHTHLGWLSDKKGGL
ncbi:DUF4260 family protein [Mucilaginibacter celer]|uniref:DUF4260 family protein n=2 Tax=Mucilaginibacter celer TaxID=2305508 RepID=A0A494VZF6_9SPHI|nr:DUF4260 family protein [Mucilaginibacter celer]